MAKPLSIEDSLQWTQQFAMREWRLLLPVALAFLALPQLALNLLLPARISAAIAAMTAQTIMPLLAATPWLAPVGILIELVALLGALIIVALALVPRISVREAIGLALQRLLVFLMAVILVIVGEVAVATFAMILFQLARLSMSAQQSLLIGLLFGISLVVSIRLIVLGPVVIASRAGPVAAIKLAWTLGAGAFWRLFAAVLVFMVGGSVVVLASSFALGSVFVLLSSALGVPALGPILSIVYLRVVLALFWTGFHVLAVALYRQLGGSIRGT